MKSETRIIALDLIGGGPDPPPPTKLKCYVNGEASKDCGEGEHSCEVKYDGEEPNTASQICSKEMVPEEQTAIVKEGSYHCNENNCNNKKKAEMDKSMGGTVTMAGPGDGVDGAY
jgi:hypothetical protein